MLFDSELSVRGSSQGLPSLINEVMEHVAKGSKVGGIYMTPPLYHVTNDAALEVSWKFPGSFPSLVPYIFVIQWKC